MFELNCMNCVFILRAIELLKRYYQGELTGLEDDDDERPSARGQDDGEKGGKKKKKKKRSHEGDEGGERGEGDDGQEDERSKLLTETVKPRTGMPPLLVNLAERKPERLHYLGVCGG